MIVIPAIDIIGGKCVRLTEGDYAQKKVYHQNPAEVAKEFESIGVTHLHVVDLDGAKAGHMVNPKTLQAIANETALQIDFGGGVKSEADLALAFSSGAKQVTIGSIAAKNPTLFLQWLERYGKEKLILGADVKQRKIAISGWLEQTEWDVVDFIQQMHEKGVAYCICTDISKDGKLAGPSFDLYREIQTQMPNLKLIASGGVTSLNDLRKLRKMGLYGAIVGKAIYENRISLEALAKFIQEG